MWKHLLASLVNREEGVEMFRRSRADRLKANADAGTVLATELAKDKKFRKELAAAARHALEAQQRARSRTGVIATLNRIGADERVQEDMKDVMTHLQRASERLKKKRSHKLRNTLLLLGGASAVAAVPSARGFVVETATKLAPTRGNGREPSAGERRAETSMTTA